MTVANAVRKTLLALPRTREQWEPDMGVVWQHEGARLTALARMAMRAPSGPTLDIGIGYGYSAAALRAAGRSHIIGIEHPFRDLLQTPEWRGIVEGLGLCPVLSDARRLPFLTGSFTCVCCAEVIEHIPPTDLPNFLGEIRRILADGGLFVATTPNLVRLTNRIAMIRGKSPFDLPVPSHGQTFGHLREYAEYELRSLLHSARLQVAEVAYASGAPTAKAFTRAWLAAALEELLPRLGMVGFARYLVVAATAV